MCSTASADTLASTHKGEEATDEQDTQRYRPSQPDDAGSSATERRLHWRKLADNMSTEQMKRIARQCCEKVDESRDLSSLGAYVAPRCIFSLPGNPPLDR